MTNDRNLDAHDEELVYEGPRFNLRRATFKDPDRTREWVDAPDACAVVAYDDEQLYLIRQAREAIGRADTLELPAGLMDQPGESPQQAAARELREEIGMEAGDWVHATSYFSSSGFTDEQVHVFLATGLTKVAEPDADGEEGLDLVTWPLANLDGLIDAAVDAKTLVGLLWLRRARDAGGAAGTGA